MIVELFKVGFVIIVCMAFSAAILIYSLFNADNNKIKAAEDLIKLIKEFWIDK
jgi:hypothetical protein